jgi:hypothetical protein
MLATDQVVGAGAAPHTPIPVGQGKKAIFTDLTEPIIFFVRPDASHKEAFQVRYVDIEDKQIMSVLEKVFWSPAANKWLPTHKQLWMEMGALGNLLRMASHVYAKGSVAELQWFARRQHQNGMPGTSADVFYL